MPGGAMGVASNEYEPSIALNAKKCWVLAAGTHQFEYDVALLGETTPVGNEKRGGKSGHASREAVFPIFPV